MSRHRQVRGMDFGEDYEGYYDVYGHSVEDDYCVSPSTAQFLYPRGDKSQQLAAFMAEEGGIKEEDEEEEDIKEPEEKSLSQVRSQLSETDQAKLLSCLEEMHNILGDSQPEHVLINAIISHQFNLDQALNTLLQSSSTSNVATALPQRQDRRQERDLNSDIISSEIVSVNEMATKPISAGAELHCQKSPCTRTISVDKTPSAHEGSKAGSDWLNPQTDEQQSVVLGKSCGCGGGAPKTLLFSYLSNGEEEAGSAPPLTRSVRIPPGFEKSCMRTKERLLAEPKSTGLLVASPSTTRVVADSESLASLTTLLDKQPVSLFELAVGADNGNRTEAPSLAAMAAAHGLAESDQASVCSLANLKETEMPFHSGSSAPQSIVASTQRRTRVQASRIAEHGEAMRQERLPASLAVLAALDKGAPSGARIVSLADLARHDLHLTGSSVLSDVAAAGAQRAEESVAALPQTSHAQSKCVADAAACHRDPSVTSHRPHTSVSTLPFTQHSTETTTTFVNIPRTVTTNSPLTQFLLSSLASSPDCKTTNPPPSQFSLSSLASSPDCTPANPLPSQFSLSSLASSPDCKATNPPPSQFSLSSLASSPDFKTTNPPPSQFSLSSLASSPDCKTTNHPPSQFSLSSLASSPDCKTTNSPSSQFSLLSLVSSIDCKTTNPPPSQFSLSSLASSPDCKPTNPPCAQFSLSSHPSVPHGVVLLPGHDATSLPQCGWASDNKSPASIDREDLRTSAPRPSAHQEVNFDLSLTDGFPFRQPQSSTSGANVSALSKKPSGFAHALCCRPSAPYRVNIFEPSDFLLRRDGLTSSEVRSQPNLYWVLRALYQAGTKEGADVLSLRSNSYGQESEKADLEANPSDSHPGMDAVPSGSHSGKDAEPSDGHPGRDAVPSRSHSGNDAGPSDSGSEVVESEADLDTASCDSSLDSAVTTYVNTTAPLGDSDTPESVAGREACSDIKASVTDSDSEQKQTRIVVPFDFGTPSPDDIVLSRQREAFREGYGQRSQRKMPVVQKAPSDRLLPKPVVVVPPGDATARITNSVAMINFSGQRTEGFEMPKKETRSGSGSGSGSRPMSRERTPDRTPEKSPEKTLEVPPRKTRTLEQATDASSPAPASTPSLPKSASKAKGLDKLDMEMEYEKRKATKKQMLNLVVIGHVDAGKSTLMGHVLYKLGQVNQRTMHKYEQESRKQGKSSFAFAWVLDETPEERQRGVTMDVAQTQFETDTKSVTLLDAPGHKDFIPNMITGAASADVAVLVVCATRGEFETGFESGGQTREHALLVRSLGVSQLGVAVNKMDTVGWSQERFDEITRKLMQFLKQAGFKEKDVSFVPCSGLSGENLVAAATDPLLCSWYGGPSMLQVIDRFAAPQRPVDKPFRLVVSDVYKGMGSGFCVSGRIEAGSVQTGEKVLVMPTGDMALVKAIQLQDDLVTCAFAGDHVIVTLFNIEMTSAAIGHVLCYAAQPIRVASVIQARIVVFNIDMPITRGFPVVFHYQMLNETAVIRKLISQLHKSNGEVIKKRPRCLTKQSNALIELAIERPICMELYKDNRDLGRFMLRYSGHTIAAGLVTEIIS
ncbi:PREDICTED: uncharacterized protein LOC106805498 isoform X2 [Priapulus caudatus]|uniref:Uncharacterized protein LOC106805498 isoform X2 n=1 Tax=Priapulus caudatus TaxID=37621 RepID=A0ABM1DRN8_PRICU|nr:PREDICTED: uncharacterized protein LOC106805498 isoform X2 [Priapulus caudatus]